MIDDDFGALVTQALAATHDPWCDRRCDCRGEDEAARLAPRLVAAIEHAARTGYVIGRAAEKSSQPSEAGQIVAVAYARGEALHVLRVV